MLSRLLRIGLVLLTLSLPTRATIQLGIDRLQQKEFAPLMGKRVGVITSQTGGNTEGMNPRLVQSWESPVNRFETARGPYLRY